MAKVTIQVMAKELGLSRNTVALALKDSEQVSETTKKIVREYAERVGYMNVAQKVVSQNCYKIMVLKREDKASYWDQVLSGITEEARKANCIVTVSVISSEDESKLQFPLGYDDSIDAFLFVHTFSKEYMDKITQKQKIAVLLDIRHDILENGYPADIIKSEGRRSIMQLTDHLIKQGLRKIAYVGAININCDTAIDRKMGFLDAMYRYRIPVQEEYVLTSEELSKYDDSIKFSKMIDSFDELPEGIVCANDDTANKLTRELRSRNIRVPEDVLITGFDDEEEKILEPFFTTVHVDAKSLGRRMVKQAIWRAQNRYEPYEMITVDSKIIIRKSSQR